MTPARVLVVDDEPQIIRGLRLILREAGSGVPASRVLSVCRRRGGAEVGDGREGAALPRRPVLALCRRRGEAEVGDGAGGSADAAPFS